MILKYMKLKILIENKKAIPFYKTAEKKEDAGLDLYVLENIFIKPFETVFIDFGIQCEMINGSNDNEAY